MDKIFFVTYGGGHVRSIIPVVKELKLRNQEVSILGLTSSVIDLRKEQIKHKKIKEYLKIFEYEEIQKILKYGDMVIENSYDTNSSLEKFDIKVYLGINLWDLSLQLGSIDAALNFFYSKGRREFFPINAIEKILKYENPTIVVVTSGQRFEKAVAIAANKMNINVVRIIDLLGEDLNIPYQANVCVLNNYAKKNVISNNNQLDDKNVIVTGQPNIEFKYDKEEHYNFIEEYKIDKFDKVISFFSQPKINSRENIFEEFINYLKDNPNNLGIWKLHPNEKMTIYKEFKSLTNNLVIIKNCNANLILEESDLVITFYSTVGLQAVIAGKNLITVNLSEKKYPIEYDKLGCAKLVDNIDAFKETIESFLESKNGDYNFHEAREMLTPPRNSAINIANVIEDIQDKNRI